MSCDLLYVITDLEVGGVPLHLLRLAKAMRDRTDLTHRLRSGLGNDCFDERRMQIEVVSLAPVGPVSDMLRQEGFQVHSCNARGGRDFRVIGRFARLIHERQPRIIHSFLFHANLAARLAAKRTGFQRERLICEIQTVEVERRWHLWVDRWTHHLCRFTIGNSPSVIDHLHTRARIPSEKLRLIRGGVDADRVQSAAPIDRDSIGVPRDAQMILWVGRLDPVKGLGHLLEAFARLKRTGGQTASGTLSSKGDRAEPPPLTRGDTEGSDSSLETSPYPLLGEEGGNRPSPLRGKEGDKPTLLLVGDGPIRAQIAARIAELKLDDRVIMLGSRGDVPALLKACDLFVFPSRTEGLPNALLEAMAAGCPIVTTDVPGCRDLIQHQRTGLIVPYGDTEVLARAMQHLLTDRALARRLGEAARESARADWSITQTWNAYAAVYEEVASNSPKVRPSAISATSDEGAAAGVIDPTSPDRDR